jgi:hypothetical protein
VESPEALFETKEEAIRMPVEVEEPSVCKENSTGRFPVT